MRIAYNPTTAAALTAAPSNDDITFDLKGIAIYVKGVKFKGTDTTYSIFKKHTSDNKEGYNGLVPVPSYTTTTTRYLREDGTWVVPTNYYRPISVNGTSILENNNTALNLVAGTNISITAENSSGYTGKVTITNTGVRSVATGTTNGTISVNTNGTTIDVAVKGLGSAAYTSSDSYAVKKTLTNENLNDVITPGFYNSGGGNTCINKPENVDHFGMIVTHCASGSYYVQILFEESYSNLQYRRHCINGTWSNWTLDKLTDTTYSVVSSSANGLAPKVINTNTATVGTAYYVLASSNGSNTPSWYQLPANAFKNDNTTYTFVSGNGGFTVTPSGGTAQVVSIGNVDWANITNKPDTFTPSAHTHATDNITKLTGYTKATSASDLATTDTLNTALGKLEYKAHYAYDWVTTVTATDTDEYINKWGEIVGFLDSVKEGTDILEEFVTCNTAQTITGLKTFESNSSTTGVSLILKNKGWTGSMSTAMDFYNGCSYTVPNARIETKMVGSGNAGGTLIFYTQTKHESTNPNPNGLTERFRIGDDGTSKITGTFTVTGNVIANKFITSGGTSSQFVKGDGSLDSNTYLTSLPSHNHSYLKGWSDTRSVETTPNDYNDTFKVVGIKSAGTTLGLTSTQTGNHATIIGWRGWCDSTGGYSWEIASTDKNRLYVRSGSTTSWNNGWQAIAYLNDIPTVTNYYWADIKVSSSSSTKTTPTFKTATATVSVTTPLVNSTGRLTLNATNTGLDLKFGNDETKSVILNGTAFKPFDLANNKLTLGSSSARWSDVYSYLGNFKDTVHIYADSSGNYTEGIRLYGTAKDSTWSNIQFGCDPVATSGTHANQWLIGRDNNNRFVFRNNTTDRLYVLSDGKVGINVVPTQMLHVNGNAMATNLGVNAQGGGNGISLYNGVGSVETHGIAFNQTSNWETHGYVTGDWATYFTMNNQGDRGWIFRAGSNRFSIDGDGHAYANGLVNANYFISRVTTGTQPYQCTSTTLNTNLNADLLDGQHGSRYLKALGGSNYVTITVDGDAATYYPVVISSVSDKYPMQFVNISRNYSDTAPSSWYSSTHKGGLTLTLLWNGSHYWDGNSSGGACYCVFVNETYCTMVGGLGNSVSGKVVWLRGGGAVYHIHAMHGTSVTATVYTSTFTDSANQSFAPTTSVKGYTVRWPGDITGSSASVRDAGNSTAITLKYSSGGFSSNPSYLAAWNGYQITYVAPSYVTVGSATLASTVTVNSSDSNSTYRMVWHSGNTLYGTGGIYCNPSTDYLYATSMNASDWFRSSGNTGWYNPTNNCHVYPNATTTYGGLMLRGEKGGYTGFILGTSTNYMNLMDNGTDKGLYQEGKLWILYYNRNNNYVGIRTSSLSDPLTVAGVTRIVASDRYLRIGPQNASHAHYETNADRSHWFNKRVEVNGILNPYVNNSFTCGTNDYRWSNVYSVLGNFSGDQTLYGLTSTCNKANHAGYMNSALQIREYNFDGAQSDTWAIAPRLSWHWSGRVQTQIGLSSSGDLKLSKDNFATVYLLLHTGNSSVSGGGSSGGSSITVNIGGTSKTLTIPTSLPANGGNAYTANGAYYVFDYNATTTPIYIGFASTGLTSTTASHLAAYGTTSSGARCIKNISADEAKKFIGLGNVQNTAFYKRVVTVNGSGWDMAGINSNAAFTIYAPTTAGTSGQVLTSTAGTPGWTNQSSLSAGYLKVHDIRNNNYAPNSTSWPQNNIRAWFNNTGTPDGTWWSGITVKGQDNTYNVWQLTSTSHDSAYNIKGLFFRTGNGSTWDDWQSISTTRIFTVADNTSVADFVKGYKQLYAGQWFSRKDYAWAQSATINVGSYGLDRMRYSAVCVRTGDLTGIYQQSAMLFVPTFSDRKFLYLAQMYTSGTAGSVTTSVKRYADYDTIIQGSSEHVTLIWIGYVYRESTDVTTWTAVKQGGPATFDLTISNSARSGTDSYGGARLGGNCPGYTILGGICNTRCFGQSNSSAGSINWAKTRDSGMGDYMVYADGTNIYVRQWKNTNDNYGSSSNDALGSTAQNNSTNNNYGYAFTRSFTLYIFGYKNNNL